MIMFVPNAVMRSATKLWALWPRLSKMETAATPIMTPSMESKLRIWFFRRLTRAAPQSFRRFMRVRPLRDLSEVGTRVATIRNPLVANEPSVTKLNDPPCVGRCFGLVGNVREAPDNLEVCAEAVSAGVRS